MWENDLISVIVPVYKVEQYLEKCIRSILNQTYRNLEILLVDDGSPDRCPMLCDAYAREDRRIRVIHKVNGGLSDARNAGLGAASGDYIVFVDSDDSITPRMIELLYRALKRDNADLSLCSWLCVDEQNRSITEMNRDTPVRNEVLTGEQAIEKLFRKKSVYYIVAWNKLYKKELFRELRFPFGRLHEDEFVVQKIFGQCRVISCISDSLYYYLQRPDSIMGRVKQNANGSYLYDRFDIMMTRMHDLKELRLNVWAAEAYKAGALQYYQVFIQRGDEAQKKRMKKEIRKNYGITRYLQIRNRVPLLMLCLSPSVYRMYIQIRSGLGRRTKAAWE